MRFFYTTKQPHSKYIVRVTHLFSGVPLKYFCSRRWYEVPDTDNVKKCTVLVNEQMIKKESRG